MDVNGDARPDFVQSRQYGGTVQKRVYLNNGANTSGGWSLSSNWTLPSGPYFVDDYVVNPYHPVDLNADGYEDFIYNGSTTDNARVYINTGSGWATSTSSWLPLPTAFVNTATTTNVRLIDVNGDMLTDILKADEFSSVQQTYLNTGSGWATSTVWNTPQYFVSSSTDLGTVFIELNADGLPDFIRSSKTGATTTSIAYLNTGSGWATSTEWIHPTSTQVVENNKDMGFRFGELNGDGATDFVRGCSCAAEGSVATFLNTNSGWRDVYLEWLFPSAFVDTRSVDTGVRFIDINADTLSDFIVAGEGVIEPPDNKRIDFNSSKKVDLLTSVILPEGGTTTVGYKSSHSYMNDTTPLNMNLPYPIFVVDTTNEVDGSGNSATTSYSYEGGKMYWNSANDRKFAGFNSVTKTDAVGNVTKSYFHQASTTESSLGEYQDHVSKLGKIYRVEYYGTSSNLFTTVINKWDKTDLSNGRTFVRLAETLTLNYEGDSDHRDILETYGYASSTGNIAEKINWGEVTGTASGTYTDIGSDKFTTTYTYATNTTYNMYAFPSNETVKDQSGNKVRESRFYYDSLSAGSIDKGNLTKQEMWATSSTYIDIEKTYTSYGLVATEKDPKDNTTTYIYDTYNLYPATTSNPMSHVTGRQFDYSSGKIRIINNPDSRVFHTTYDGFDRVVEEKQPDLTTPTTLVTKTTYTYTDTGLPTKIQRTDYLNTATSTDSYTYFDGYGRKIEDRIEGEGSNTFVVKEYVYNKLGQMQRESLPYFASSTSYAATTTNNGLFIWYTYDALGRVKAISNAVGTTTNAYDDWVATTTDALGNYKSYAKDAYGNLTTVLEKISTTTYLTRYEFDGNNKLKKITDAEANIRNFTYDGLGRRLTAQDLHDAADGTYGTWTFTYDVSGNISTTTDPKSQTIGYTYDALNRVLSENYTGGAGTEITYAYDSCANGRGKLCSATTTSAVSRFTYNPLGLTASETKILSSTSYVISYTYDRLGNKTDITYPDSSQAKYVYNSAGQLEAVLHKESAGTYANVISNFDYGPHGQITTQVYGNGVTTTKTYDASELYRLRQVMTVGSSTGGIGGGGSELLALEDALGLNNEPFIVYEATTTDSLDETLEEDIATSSEIEESISSTTEPIQPEVPLEGVSTTATTTDSDSSSSSSNELIIPSQEENIGEGIPTIPVATATPTTSDVIAMATATSLTAFLQDKSADLKATIKGQEIAKVTFNDREEVGKYTIQITGIEPIEKGVAVFARVLENGAQIGFGKTGTVDIERFIIINPPILVADPEGNIVRTSYNKLTDQVETFTYREDFHEALLQTLQGILDVKKEKFDDKNIKTDEVGRTTTTVYPDANPETNSVDGFAAYDASTSTWSSIQGAADGGSANDTNNYSNQVYVGAVSPWFWLYRGFYLFDTSSINDSDAVSTASFSLYIHTGGIQTYNTGSNKYISLVSSNPGSVTSIGVADYDQVGSTKFASDINVSSLSATAYNTWTLNNAGTSSISKTSATKLALRHGQDLNNETPSNGGYNGILGAKWADEAGTTQDPRLVIEHTYATPTASTTETGIQSLLYTYDSVGNITDIIDNSFTGTGKKVSYTYDSIYRLLSASTTIASSTSYRHTFAYTPIGNISAMATSGASTTYTYAETSYTNPHAPTQIGGASLTYDTNGNVTQQGPATYTWDYRNRMTAANNGSATTTYTYDHTFERVTKVGSTTTYYPNDLYSKEGATTTRFIFGNNLLLATVEGNGTASSTKYYHQDHLGGTNMVTNSSGTVITATDYYPYGSTRIDVGSYDADRTYIGEMFDPETNLSYLNWRYMESNRGQFLSQDPVFVGMGIDSRTGQAIQDPQQLNSYTYARNNPISNKDPNGDFANILLGAGVGAGIGFASQAIGDAIVGEFSGWNAYTGAVAGGAVQGALIGSGAGIPGMILAGVAGGATQGLTREGLDNVSGDSAGFEWDKVKSDAVLGGVSGLLQIKGIAPRVSGITAGQGSMQAVSNSVSTKLANGTISSISSKTAGKVVASTAVNGAYGTGLIVGADVSSRASNSAQLKSIEKQLKALTKQVNALVKKLTGK